ncbi:MAG TPA: MerC domain-containing protein [Gammaproteobacteria bacterium]|jgi:hypothetical protein|nr:MerC domain-containing protein [Gammaproteobacteria bacterium]
MNVKTQLTTDKLAATFSLACIIHCFFAPSFLILTSGFIFTSLDNELIHKIILFIAMPVSIYALILGYKNHNALSFLCLGILGLLTLITAVLLGESLLGESGEKLVTLIGSCLVCFAHFRNYQACINLDCSSCHEK